MATTNGYDAPVLSHEEDFFGRWSFASRVYSIVGKAPAEWSLRAAIYGKWGEGKTSVLNFLQNMAEKDGHIVLTVNPWDADSTDALWAKLADALITKLGQVGVEVDRRTTSKAWVSKQLNKYFPRARKVADIHSYAKVAVGGWTC